jgi:hypothetical protein
MVSDGSFTSISSSETQRNLSTRPGARLGNSRPPQPPLLTRRCYSQQPRPRRAVRRDLLIPRPAVRIDNDTESCVRWLLESVNQDGRSNVEQQRLIPEP